MHATIIHCKYTSYTFYRILYHKIYRNDIANAQLEVHRNLYIYQQKFICRYRFIYTDIKLLDTYDQVL